MKVASYKLFGYLILIVILGGCTYGSIKPDSAREYRHFPEYGGYLPIEQPQPAQYNPLRVRADWVLPVTAPDGKADYRLPSTQEEAKQRVNLVMEGKKVLHPVLAVPIGIALAPLFLSVGEYYAHTYPEKLQQKQKKQLEEFVGIRVLITATDSQGKPVAFARVLELVSPVQVPVFVDKDGVRRFTPPEPYVYPLSTQMLQLTAEHLPVYIGQRIRIPNEFNVDFGNFFGVRDTVFTGWGDRSGWIAYTSLAASRFAQYMKKEERWTWARTPEALTMHFIVWAPGFKPQIKSLDNIYPHKTVNLKVSLERLPDGDKTEKTFSDFIQIFNVLSRSIRHSSASQWKVDTVALMSVIQRLEEFAGDETLSGFIRYNACYLLQSIYINSFMFKNKELSDTLQKAFERAKAKTKAAMPYLSDNQLNPWQLKERYERLLYRKGVAQEQGSLYNDYISKIFETTPETVKEIEEILAGMETMTSDSPELDTLRALLALSIGDRTRAALLSRFLSHSQFFSLFYSLKVVEPQ